MPIEMITMDDLTDRHPGVMNTYQNFEMFVQAGIENGVSRDDIFSGAMLGLVALVSTGQTQEARDGKAALFEDWATFLRSGQPLMEEVAGTA